MGARIIRGMPGFLEAVVTLFPADAGGRERPIAPRDGNYHPALRTMKRSAIPIRFIEGPPWIAPGQDGRVVAEIEAEAFDDAGLAAGCELDLAEREHVVGIVTVIRLWSDVLAE